jgi:hypothetical protein
MSETQRVQAAESNTVFAVAALIGVLAVVAVLTMPAVRSIALPPLYFVDSTIVTVWNTVMVAAHWVFSL